MKSERESKIQHYGKLVMRPFDIAGNKINAFYDAGDNLVFVLDNTISVSKPNVLLVINPDADKKWDEILSNDYNVDLETIRPKQDNKYQKLDIEYSGLGVYDNLIRAYMADDDMEDYLDQLNVLRDSAARHSAVMRLNAANDVISKTNITIVKTKETIVNLQERLKTLRAKLSATKKEIGKVSTKQSAAKILKIESQIEATNEKLKRAKKRLESAQRRLESATVDAELASDLLNQPESDIAKNKSVVVAPKHEIEPVVFDDGEGDDDDFDDDESDDEIEEVEEQNDIKPLFNEDPQILDDNIAFKPIEFNAPVFSAVDEDKEKMAEPEFDDDLVEDDEEEPEQIVKTEEKPILESFEPVAVAKEESLEPKPVLETMTPVAHEEIVEEKEPEQFVAPVVPIMPTEPVMPRSPIMPAAPAVNKEPVSSVEDVHDEKPVKPAFIYYILLLVLILLSVFTLWMYQKNVKTTSPVLTAKANETVVAEQPKIQKTIEPVAVPDETEVLNEDVFIDDVEEPQTANIIEAPAPAVVEEEPVIEETVEGNEEPEEYDEENIAPEIMGAIPARVMGSVNNDYVEPAVASEQDVIATKPVYDIGSKYEESEQYENVASGVVNDDFYEDPFFDEEEAAYQAEQNM